MSHKISTPLSVVRSRETIGTTASLDSWSMLKTEKPPCIAARDRPPWPAKSSTKRGTFEFCAGETAASRIQSE